MENEQLDHDAPMDSHGPRSGTGTPEHELALAGFLSREHGAVRHHLSASQSETVRVPELLSLADAEDRRRWDTLQLGYTDPLGAPWLRDAIAATYREAETPDVVCFAGAQEALFAVLHALLGRGDHAIVVLPNYPAVEALMLSLCGVSGVALDPGDGWSLDLDAVARVIRPNTRLIAISFPNNPTGHILPPAQLDVLVALCRRHGIWLLSDEVYRLTERDPARRLPQAVDRYERGISLGALSKAHGLPGLRIGWAACRDPWLVARMAMKRQYLSTCSAGPSEVLARIAIKAAATLIARNRRLAEANLSLLCGFLDRHPVLFDWTVPEGGMVGYVRYKGPDGVEAWTRRMAREAGVLLLPASMFRSTLLELPANRFRVGFGCLGVDAGLEALERALG